MEKVLLTSLGSRGDMEPFLALGEELRVAGLLLLVWQDFCSNDDFNLWIYSQANSVQYLGPWAVP